MDAVVLDLFGTLVAAPTPRERVHAAVRLAHTLDCDPAVVDDYFLSTWPIRHDGTLPALADLATHLVDTVGARATAVEPVTHELRALGRARLAPDVSVVEALQSLRGQGRRLGVLSDASAEIAAAWPASSLAPLMDAAVFSCEIGCTKPDQRLYARISRELDVPVRRTLYVGDGGGDELHGALAHGMAAVAVRRRGPNDALAFGDTAWSGPVLDAIETLPTYLAERL